MLKRQRAGSVVVSSAAQGEEWWQDPSNCSDACFMWKRQWNPDWDFRSPPTGEKSKVGKIRHLLFIRHGQYDLD